jgi:hypothetical protein
MLDAPIPRFRLRLDTSWYLGLFGPQCWAVSGFQVCLAICYPDNGYIKQKAIGNEEVGK